MKFKFAFDKLLQHRKREEELAMRDYLNARDKYDEAVAQLNRYYQDIADTRTQASQLTASGGHQAEALKHGDEFITGQLIRIERHRTVLRTLNQEMEEKYEIAVQKAQETKALDKLKEKWHAEHKDLLKKQEQKELDDLVTMRFGMGSEDI